MIVCILVILSCYDVYLVGSARESMAQLETQKPARNLALKRGKASSVNLHPSHQIGSVLALFTWFWLDELSEIVILVITCLRGRCESSSATSSKACREKQRRDRLNDK